MMKLAGAEHVLTAIAAGSIDIENDGYRCHCGQHYKGI